MNSQQIDSKIRNVIIELFPKYDQNGDGRMNAQEFSAFLKEANNKLGVWEGIQSDEAIKMFDKNWDGQMSKE